MIQIIDPKTANIELKCLVPNLENSTMPTDIKITYAGLSFLYCISGQDISTGQRVGVGDSVEITAEILNDSQAAVNIAELFGIQEIAEDEAEHTTEN